MDKPRIQLSDDIHDLSSKVRDFSVPSGELKSQNLKVKSIEPEPSSGRVKLIPTFGF